MDPARLALFAAGTIGLAIASVLAAPNLAYALCGAPAEPTNPESMLRDVEPGQVLFVGAVAETRARGYNALFHIEQVWYGAPLNEWMTCEDRPTRAGWLLRKTCRSGRCGRALPR